MQLRRLTGGSFQSPILKDDPSPSLANVNFVGCMPVNFSRHNIDQVQRSAGKWILSE